MRATGLDAFDRAPRTTISTLAHIASPLLPFVEIRVFRSREREAALEWAAAIHAEEPAA